MKRIVTIQDISCVGKCSLTVALPIISAFGVECAILPPAVLSTHTMFKEFTFRDLSGEFAPIAAHWKRENLQFDAIYTGYLGSFELIGLVSDFIRDFRSADNLVFIDPVMADNGKFYPGFGPEYARAMAELCGGADVIVPNLTEAAFLLNRPCRMEGYDEAYIRDLLKRLVDLGAKSAVLTGVRFSEGEIGVMGYDGGRQEFFHYFHRRIDVAFHGTGDIFSSTALGALMRGFSLEKALALAADYTVECIERTMASPDHVFYGVEFERTLPYLIRRIESASEERL